MIRYLLTGMVAIAAMSVGAALPRLLGGRNIETGRQSQQPVLEVMKLDPLSVPIVRKGSVEGYVIVRVSIAAPAADLKVGKALIGAYASEAAFKAIHDESAFGFAALKPLQAAALSERIHKLANERAGRIIISQVMIEALNYVSARESRGQN